MLGFIRKSILFYVTLVFSANSLASAPVFDEVDYDIDFKENSVALIIAISAEDADGGSVTYSVKDYGDGAKFKIGEKNGKLKLKSKADYENPKDAGKDNVYSLKVAAKSGSKSSTQIVNITITDENDNAPVLTNIKAKDTVNENHYFVKAYTASDIDTVGTLSWSLAGVDADLFSINSVGSLFLNTPEDFENPTNSNNLYSVIVTVNDGVNTTYGPTTIKVKNAATRDITYEIKPAAYIVHDASTPAKLMATYVEPNYDWDLWTGDPDFSWDVTPELNPDLSYGSYEYAVASGFVGYWEDHSDYFGTYNWMNNYYDDYVVDTSEHDDALFIRLEQQIASADCSTSLTNSKRPLCNLNLEIYKFNPSLGSYVFYKGISTDSKNKTIKLPVLTKRYLIRVQQSSSMSDSLGNSPYYLYAYRAGNTPSDIQNAFAMVSNHSDTAYSWYKPDLDLSKPDDSEYAPNRILVYKRNDKIRGRLAQKNNVHFNKLAEIASTEILIKEGFSVVDLNPAMFAKLSAVSNAAIKAAREGTNSDSINGEAPTNPRIADGVSQMDSTRNIILALRRLYPDNEFKLDFKVKAHSFSYDRDYIRYQEEYFDMVNAEEGLNLIGTGDNVADVTVAVIDTGAPTKSSRAWNSSSWADEEYDFVSYDSDATDPAASQKAPYQEYGSHGTHVATTIAAKNDGNNINGFGLKVMPLRALDENGSGYTSDICNAIAFAGQVSNDSGEIASKAVDVINMSLGGGYECGCQSVINDVYDNGVTIVASAGNGIVDEDNYPASCDNVLSVSSIASTGEKAYYSSFGANVDISAPGGDAYVDHDGDGDWDGIWAFDKDNQLSLYQGTSMAAPVASAVIGNIYAKYPNTTSKLVDGLIKKNLVVSDKGADGFDRTFGYGMVDLEKVGNLGKESLSDVSTSAKIKMSSNNLNSDRVGTINIKKIGSGTSIKVLNAYASHEGILIAPDDVNGKGFGDYAITLKKGQFYNKGRIQETVSFQVQDKYTTEIMNYPIIFQVGTGQDVRPAADIGRMVLLNRIAAEGEFLQDYTAPKVIRVEGNTTDSYQLEDTTYISFKSTDMDFDLTLCDFGEICWAKEKAITSDVSGTIILDGSSGAVSGQAITNSEGKVMARYYID